MRHYPNPPPGAVYYSFEETESREHVAVFPMIRGKDGRDWPGEPIDLFATTRAAMAVSERLNRVHRELLLDNIRNSPGSMTGAA